MALLQVGLTGKRCKGDIAFLRAIRLANAAPGGADRPLYLLDARPRVNALANQAKGLSIRPPALDCILLRWIVIY